MSAILELEQAVKKVNDSEDRSEIEEISEESHVGEEAVEQKDYQQQEAEYSSNVNYDELFDYLGSGSVEYSNETDLVAFESGESTNACLNDEEIDNIMQRKMLSDMLGGIPDYVDPDEETQYENFRLFDKSSWWWKARYLNNSFGARDIN